MRILVIEDNRDAAVMLTAILTRRGHEVRTAYSGRSGLVQAKVLMPDAVISDIGLPDITGYEIAQELRKDEPFKDTLLIALSGYGQPLDVETAKAAGYDHHMTKPCDIDRLIALLSSREPA